MVETIVMNNTKEEVQLQHISTMIGHVTSSNMNFYSEPVSDTFKGVTTHHLDLKDHNTGEVVLVLKVQIGVTDMDKSIICILESSTKEVQVYHINKMIESLLNELSDYIVDSDDEGSLIILHAIKMLHANVNIHHHEHMMMDEK